MRLAHKLKLIRYWQSYLDWWEAIIDHKRWSRWDSRYHDWPHRAVKCLFVEPFWIAFELLGPVGSLDQRRGSYRCMRLIGKPGRRSISRPLIPAYRYQSGLVSPNRLIAHAEGRLR